MRNRFLLLSEMGSHVTQVGPQLHMWLKSSLTSQMLCLQACLQHYAQLPLFLHSLSVSQWAVTFSIKNKILRAWRDGSVGKEFFDKPDDPSLILRPHLAE